jgi:hypothetical protein
MFLSSVENSLGLTIFHNLQVTTSVALDIPYVSLFYRIFGVEATPVECPQAEF